MPHGLHGRPILNLGGGETTLAVGEASQDIVVQRRFSNKPKDSGKFSDFFEKIESYLTIVAGPAMECHNAPETDNNPTAAAEAFDLVAKKYPDAVGESGLSLRPLAMFRLFEIEPHENGPSGNVLRRHTIVNRNTVNSAYPSVAVEPFISWETLCSNLVCHPTPLTRYLLNEIQERWALEIPNMGSPLQCYIT